ncbi:1-acyl-sn-glycerol-3-phosphate acyltransferase [Sulfidibacter corallicola]
MSEKMLTLPCHHRIRDIWRHPLPDRASKRSDRIVIKTMAWVCNRYVVDIENGLDALALPEDPFILVLNHNQRIEAVAVPTLLMYYRGGRPVHFMADWNFLMMPIVAQLYRKAETIIVTNKSAKPKFLNMFKPLFREERPAFERALDLLRAGASVGIFPEGTINRNPHRLMRGLPGAAGLALRSGVKVIPVGIRFPYLDPAKPISDGAKMSLHVGNPLVPPNELGIADPTRHQITEFHHHIMTELAEVSGKSWDPHANKRRKYVL